ncbi:MAG: corrinoid protein [Rhodothermales bacterium]|nr:corrinoid protein [Rhodothermales bacterium]
MSDVVRDLFDAIVSGDRDLVLSKVADALSDGLAPTLILDDGMIAAMAEVGDRFERGEFYIPEMLIASRAMQAGLATLKPHLIDANVESIGTVVAGTVRGDMHDIGKNLVVAMLKGAGFEIVDLGVDVAADDFIEAVRSRPVDLVALSAMLTTTMPQMERTIRALEAAGARDGLKVMVGGAPVSKAYAKQIGADGYAPDASRAVALARSLIE